MGIFSFLKKKEPTATAKDVVVLKPTETKAIASFKSRGSTPIIASGTASSQAPSGNIQRAISSGGGGGGSSAPTPTPTTTSTITANQSGSVTSGAITSHGNAIVQGSGGLTANQLQAIAFKEAQKQGIKRRGTFTAKFDTKFQDIKKKVQQKITQKKDTKPKGIIFVKGKKGEENLNVGDSQARQSIAFAEDILGREKGSSNISAISDEEAFALTGGQIGLAGFQSKIKGISKEEALVNRAEFIEGQQQKKLEREQQIRAEREAKFTELNAPAMVRKASYEVGKIGSLGAEFLFKKTTGRGFNPVEKEKSADIIGTSLLFAGITPSTPSTFQMQQAMATSSKVAIVGVTSKEAGVFSTTRAKFLTQTGKEVKKGFAVAVSKSGKGGKSVTYSEAGIPQSAIEFPTSRIGTKVVDKADALTYSLTKDVAGNKVQISYSGVKQGNDVSRELSLFKISEGTKALTFKGKSVSKLNEVDIKGFLVKTAEREFKPISSIEAGTIQVTKTALNKEQIKVLTESISKVASKQQEIAVAKIMSSPKPVVLPPQKTSLNINQNIITPKTQIVPAVSITKDIQKNVIVQTPKITQLSSSKSRGRGRAKSLITQKVTQDVKIDTIQIPKSDTSVSTKRKQSPRLSTLQRQQIITTQETAFVPTIPTIRTPTRKIPKGLRFKRRKKVAPTRTFGTTVSLRRYGKFKTIASGISTGRAISIGSQRASSTLGATFKITGFGKGKIRTPKGFKRKKDKKEGLLFIEKRKFRLSKRGEKVEIQEAKRKKKK